MNLFAPILSYTASGLLVLLALTAIARRRFNYQKRFFIPLVFVFAFIMILVSLIVRSGSPDQTQTLLRILIATTISSPAFGIPFFRFFARESGSVSPWKSLPAMMILFMILFAGSFLIPIHHLVRAISMEEKGFLYQLSFTWAGKGLGVFILLVNVCYLYFMENTYRAANIQGKVTLKYPMLGMLTASLLNFVVMSRLLSLSSVDRRFLIVETCGIIIVAVTFLYANIRYNFFEIGIPAKKENNSTITVMIAGLYFISIGLISWISALAGLPYDRFHLYVIGIFIAFLLLSIGISGRVRRRLRIFLNDNFYLENYNYRREWRHFSRLMATSLRIEDFLSNTIGSLCETVMVQRGIIWVDIRNGKEASYGATGEDWTPETPGWLLSLCRDGRFEGLNRRFNRKIPSLAERSGEEESDHIPCWIRFIAPLGHGEETKGFIALGVKDTGAPFGQEDETFLETIADQALITIDNLLMEERFLESKQIESFNRFASFVIHDLKNTVGMLSLTAENARENMDDKEFQKDTIQTIKRSVEKMQDLINSLNAHKYPGNISRTRTEIVSLVRDKAAHLMPAAQNRKISLDFSPPGELYAHVDRSAIERIIENLILNSVDATGENGKITITISVDDREGITLTVADTGKGFDAEYLKNDLFKPFSSTKKNGLGIGLALCKSMIEAHGGSISINNLGGNGAVVSIKIPGIDSN